MLSYATVQKYLYKIWEIKIQCTWEKYMYKHHYTIYSITGWLKDKLTLIWKVQKCTWCHWEHHEPRNEMDME